MRGICLTATGTGNPKRVSAGARFVSPFVRAVGFAALLTTATALLVVAVARTPDLPVWAVAACAALIVAATAAVVAGRDRVVEAVAPTPLGVDDALDVVAAVAGAVVTYLLSVTGGLGPVVASALVGFIAGVIVRRVAVSAYCGSFVGMASPSLFSDLVLIAVAGLVAGLGLVAAREAFGGFGGKLGTLALFGTLATAALTGVDFATGSAVSWGLAPVALSLIHI